jgi:hypothetical protein
MAYASLLVLRLSAQDPVPPPPHAPPANPFDHAVAAAGIVEAQGENIALGVPEAGLVTAVYVRVWDTVPRPAPPPARRPRAPGQPHRQRARVLVAEATESRLRGRSRA